jgi:hypothetical protein
MSKIKKEQLALANAILDEVAKARNTTPREILSNPERKDDKVLAIYMLSECGVDTATNQKVMGLKHRLAIARSYRSVNVIFQGRPSVHLCLERIKRKFVGKDTTPKTPARVVAAPVVQSSKNERDELDEVINKVGLATFTFILMPALTSADDPQTTNEKYCREMVALIIIRDHPEFDAATVCSKLRVEPIALLQKAVALIEPHLHDTDDFLVQFNEIRSTI